MFVAFFESVKYSGHLFPLAFLRIFIGYHYFQEANLKAQGDYLVQPQLAGMITEWLNKGLIPGWYQYWLESVVIPYWQVFAYLATLVQLVVAVSFLAGFLVRPAALVACLVNLNFVWMGTPAQSTLHYILFAVNITLAWFGAGRCLGFDYFFFKRDRGVWW